MTQIKQKTESNQSELKARLKDSIFVESHRGIPGFEAKVKEIKTYVQTVFGSLLSK